MKPVHLLGLVAAALFAAPSHALTFVRDHVYSTSDSAINEYTSTGALVSSMGLAGGSLHGLAFGADRNLYVVREGTGFVGGSVDALDSSGGVVRSYAFTGAIGGNISYGKIAFDPAGEAFYVGAGNGVYKFDTAAAGGRLFLNETAYDVDVLPNGELLVATGGQIKHYSNAGALLGSISSLSDPLGITAHTFPFLSDIRGIAYDPVTDSTFVTMLGYSGVVDMSFKLLKLKGLTNEIVGMENYWYGDDIALLDDSRIAVGSRTQPPGLFSTDLQYLGQFQGVPARFVTVGPIPEPETMVLLAVGFAVVAIAARRSHSSRQEVGGPNIRAT